MNQGIKVGKQQKKEAEEQAAKANTVYGAPLRGEKAQNIDD